MLTTEVLGKIFTEELRSHARTPAVASGLGRAMERISALHDARVTDLLAHNTELMERARKAECEARDARTAMLAVASVAGDLAKMLLEAPDAKR